MLNLDAATLTALQSDSFEYAYLCDLPGGLYYTNRGYDVSYDSNTYESTGLLVKMSGMSQTQELNLATYNLQLSNVDNAITKAYASTNMRGQPAIIRIAVFSNGAMQGTPIIIYKGTLDSFSVKETTRTSALNLKLTSHWASYNQKAGRYSSDALQTDIHPNDRIFKYAHAEQSNLGWGKR
jgi:hypothetical protein